ncbi:MAG TPA: serine/threonine-protein kinase [Polyangiaceae bacterium]
MSQPRQPTQVVGRYAVYGEIASGGMATIHLGRLNGPVGFSRTVAIKRLHPQYAKDPDFVAMFLDEARLSARIQSPHVVQTMDVVNEGDALFLVMEYVQGESFSRLWRTVTSAGERIPLPIIGAIVGGMLHGLHAVHEATDENGVPLGIVHRDVSPQNVIVGIDGTARVLDFGVAKAAGSIQNTREGHLKGKLQYMAPEQLSGAPVVRTIDVYAAAIVLWEALTGTLLFDGENDARIFARVLEADAPPPSHLVPEIPEAVDAVVMKGLEKDPARRWQTAREMALALEAAIRSAPASEVGPWVEALASSSLAKRAALVRELESSSAVKVPPRTIESTRILESPPTVPQAFAPMREPMPSVTQALDFSGPDEDDAPTPYHPGKSVLINRPPPASDVVPQPMSLTPLPTAVSNAAPPPSSSSGAWPQQQTELQGPSSQQYPGSNQSGSYAKPVVATAYDPSASIQYNPNASVVIVAPQTSTAMKALIAIATAALIFAIGAAVIALRDARIRALATPPPAPTTNPSPAPTIQNQIAPEQPTASPFDAVDPTMPSSVPVGAGPIDSAAAAPSASASTSASSKSAKPKPPPPTVAHPHPRPTPMPPNCNPPTRVDANGIKTVKPECM